MRSLFHRYPDRTEQQTDQPNTISITRGQLRAVIGFVIANVIILIVLAIVAFSAFNQPPIQIIQVVTQPPPLATRVPTPTPSPTPLPPSPFGGGGAIAFTLRRNGNSDI